MVGETVDIEKIYRLYTQAKMNVEFLMNASPVREQISFILHAYFILLFMIHKEPYLSIMCYMSKPLS